MFETIVIIILGGFLLVYLVWRIKKARERAENQRKRRLNLLKETKVIRERGRR